MATLSTQTREELRQILMKGTTWGPETEEARKKRVDRYNDAALLFEVGCVLEKEGQESNQ